MPRPCIHLGDLVLLRATGGSQGLMTSGGVVGGGALLVTVEGCRGKVTLVVLEGVRTVTVRATATMTVAVVVNEPEERKRVERKHQHQHQ